MKTTKEYKAIQQHYGNNIANRSKVLLMNHVDEGLIILEEIKASEYAKRAWCLHPLFQNDPEVQKFAHTIEDYHPIVIALVFEYRNIANSYLSKRVISDIHEIALSPLEEVNHMLIADKIQNYKDFIKYHKDEHVRSPELDQYFHNWFLRLKLSITYVENMIEKLSK